MKQTFYSNSKIWLIALTTLILFGCVRQQVGRGEGTSPKSSIHSVEVDDKGLSTSSKPVVNVYMENSGSMYGYVDIKQKSMFQQSVFNFLVDVQNSGIPSSFNLNFINSQILPKGNDVDAFINKITANDFKKAGGNGSHTDIAEMLKMVLENTSNDTVSIFISDCIFSPGKVNQPDAYLTGQMVSIKQSMSAYLEKYPNTMVMIYQINSPFKGTYYDYQDCPRHFEGERPYYIIVIGNALQLYNLKLSTKAENFIPGVNNYWSIFNYPLEKTVSTKYTLLMTPKKGSFNRKNPKAISKARNDDEGYFLFTMAADMSVYQHLLESDYMHDVANYARLVNQTDAKDFFMEITDDQVATSPMTLDYRISTNQRMQEGIFSLVLLRNKPEWADTMTDLDDRTFDNGNEKKTYGLHFIFDGIHQAYSAKVGDVYTSLDITVQK